VAVQVTIDAGSKADAELIAEALPLPTQATSWRGYGVVRLRVANDQAAKELIQLVRTCVEDHDLAWARVRVGDDETMFRRNGRRPAFGH
jgi:hypothetical protein